MLAEAWSTIGSLEVELGTRYTAFLLALLIVLGPLDAGAAGFSIYSTGFEALSAGSASEGFDIANEAFNPFMRFGRAGQSLDAALDRGDGYDAGASAFRAAFEGANTVAMVGAAGAASARGFHLPKRTGCATCACFVAGTMVVMADGSHRAIEQIQPGDWVLAAEPELNIEPQPFEVTHVHRNHTEALVHIVVGEEILESTREHPFWVPGEDRWVAAAELQPGDLLLKPDGTAIRVDDVWYESFAESTFNLTVDGVSTFYVVVDGEEVLVHNQNPFEVRLQNKVGDHALWTPQEIYRLEFSDGRWRTTHPVSGQSFHREGLLELRPTGERRNLGRSRESIDRTYDEA